MADLTWRKGLTLTVRQMSEGAVNLVPNPRFANNMYDGWAQGGSITPSRVVGGSPTLPSGMTAKLKLSTTNGAGTYRVANFLNGEADGNGSLISVEGDEDYAFGGWVYNPDGRDLITRIYWYDNNGGFISSSSFTITGATGGWTWWSEKMSAPATARMCQPSFYPTSGASPSYNIHITGVIFRKSHAALISSDYCDGDSDGYRWEGQRHNSYSLREANRSFELAAEAQDIDFTSKMPGGFSKLSFVVARSATGTYDDLMRENEVKLALEGKTLFEGFINSVEPEMGDQERLRVICKGPWARYAEEQTWRRVYRDTSLRAWRTDQNNDEAGRYYHDKADRLHIRIAKNVSAPAGSCRRLYYWLFDGIPKGDRIRKVEFDWARNLGSSGANWIADIMARDDPDNQEGEYAIWSKQGGTGSGSESITLTTPARCLVLRLRRYSTEAAPSGDRYVKITNMAVYASEASDAKVDTVVADIAGQIAPETSVTSNGDYTVDHAAFRRYTSRARAIRKVSRYVDGEYDYAVWEDGRFVAGDRPDDDEIPAEQTIVVQDDRPGMVWNVRRDYDKAYDGVTVRFKRPEKGEQKELVELTRPAGGYSRIKALDYTREEHMTTKMAAHVARRYLKRWRAGLDRGEVTLAGEVLTKNGIALPAVTLRAGMWIENISLPDHRPLFISKVRTDLESGLVKLRINDGDRRNLKHVIKLFNRRHDGDAG